MQSAWTAMTGNSTIHSLEARIFHVTCIFTISLFSLSIVFNYLIGLYELCLLLIPSVIAACGVYYLSKIKLQHSLAVLIFCVIGNIVWILFFLNNSGINGPGMLIYLLFFFLVMSIVPVKQRLIWVVVNIIIAFVLIAYQHNFPEAVPLKHRDDLSRSLDFAYVYFLTLLIVYFIITNVINSYNRERLLAEERAELLEMANQSKNKLFSILAHDLRSPLNSIQSFLEVSMDGDLDEEEKKIINKSLLRETKNTRQLLINLLSWSKTQMDGVNVNLIEQDLLHTLETTLIMQKSIAEEKNIVLTNAIDEGLRVVADTDMLELVIRNLVNNAIKFTPFDGEIKVSTSIQGQECWISVADNGVGIAKTDYLNIFSLSSQSTYGTNQEKGVGLGLVLCKEFVQIQQGRIWVESELGSGTVFYVSLPLVSHKDVIEMDLN
jgi:two-component system sensor histidine kinase/response regulator